MNTSNACPIIILVTVNNNETQALLDAFVGRKEVPEQVSKDGLTYNDLGEHGGYKIIHTICEMGAGGIGASQQRARDAIDHWQPRAIIAVGIAFGVDETKQKIGDVLISTQLQDYELGRENEDGTLTPRGDKASSTDILLNRFRQTDTIEIRRTQDWPKVQFGLILSGQKLVDNLNYRESLKASFTEAIGGEMEGAGLYVSASAAKIDWIVVKAICDWGHNKNQGDKDISQKLAAKNAVRVLKAVLDAGGLYEYVFSSTKVEGAVSKAKLSEQGAVPIDIYHFDVFKYAPDRLIGREAEIQLLSDAWNQAVKGESRRPRVLTFVAFGGEGKTSLVAKWVAELAHRDWPGCEAVFAWSFYSQGTKEQTAASSDLFLKEALVFFGDADMAGSAKHASEKGKRLAQLIGAQRALLILDGVEPLQYPPVPPMDGKLRDDGIAALLKGLVASGRGLCVVTTRYSILDLKAYWQGSAPEIVLNRLSKEAGVTLLKLLGVCGGTQQEFDELVEDLQGHALTLNLLGGFLKRAFNGDICRRDCVKFDKADDKMQGGHVFRTMAAYENWLLQDGDEGRREVAIMRLMGLFDRPAEADCINALRRISIPELTEPLFELEESDWEFSITSLEKARLLTVNRDATGVLLSLDSHPLLREYFARQLHTQQPEAWRAAHRRLFEHLFKTTPDKPQPTLEDLQPLYQAVIHGCRAGMLLEAFETHVYRILREKAAYSINKLGAFGSDLGAITCFFEQPWSRISSVFPEEAQAGLLNMAAFRLRPLGRLREAVESWQAGLKIFLKRKDWYFAANIAGNLSEVELTLGKVTQAIEYAEQSVIYADRSDNVFFELYMRTIHADALHQIGRRDEAEVLFRAAEIIQAGREPEYKLLYSLQGFRYCDLLLAAPERAAWQTILMCVNSGDMPAHFEVLRAVSERATQISQWIKGNYNSSSLLSMALNHLALGCSALYQAILDPSTSKPLTPRCEIETAVDYFRYANTQHMVPLGLLARAWLRSFEGNCTGSDSAQADLDEALEISERGPMPLFMADIHLYRARLFFRVTPYPWNNPDGTLRNAKDDLRDARRLIEKHDYWRRKEELEDAERVIIND